MPRFNIYLLFKVGIMGIGFELDSVEDFLSKEYHSWIAVEGSRELYFRLGYISISLSIPATEKQKEKMKIDYNAFMDRLNNGTLGGDSQ